MDSNNEMAQRLHEKLNNSFWIDVRDHVMDPARLGAVYTDRATLPEELVDAVLAPVRERLAAKLREVEQKRFMHRRATGESIGLDHQVMQEFMRDYAVNYPEQFQRGATMVNIELSGPEVKEYASQWLNSPEFIDGMDDGAMMPDWMLVLDPRDKPDTDLGRIATIADMARQRTCFYGCTRSCGWTTDTPDARYERHRAHVYEVEGQVSLLRDLHHRGMDAAQRRVASELDEMLSLEPGTVQRAITNGWSV